jgi:MFS family permease
MNPRDASPPAEEVPLTGAALAEAEAGYDRFIWANLKRNFAAHYIHGMLGMTGFRLVNAPTFIPAYLHALTGSDAIVGLGLGLQQLGGVFSPIVGASRVEHRKRVLPAAMLMGTLMRLPILGMALAGWFAPKGMQVWIFLALLFLMGIFSGAQRVVFQFLLSKMIPVARRGKLQAARNVTGGVIAAALSYVAGRYLIGGNVLGNGYATTFLIAFVLTSLGISVFRLLVREPEPPSLRPQTRLAERLRGFRHLVGSDKDYRNFLIAQTLAMAGRVAAPFYILYAGQMVSGGTMSGKELGLFSVVYLGADTISNLMWGVLGDKFGFRSNFFIALVLWIAATAILLTAHTLAPLLVAFFGLGAAQAGYMMAAQTLVLEFGDRHDVPMRLAISTTVEAAVSTVAPLIGGLLAAAGGYISVFAVSMVLYALSLATLTIGVREPRLRKQKVIEALEEEGRGGG